MTDRVKGLMIGAILAGMVAVSGSGVMAGQGQAPEIQQKLHVIYDPISREVARRMVGVVDPHPEMGLEFTWEPAAGNWPGVTPEGLAHGKGRLFWRVPGAASYDPRTMHHSYEGTLKDGRFHGQGRLSYRDGSFYAGTWVAGKLQGQGEHLDALGNRYEGPFVNGQPDGEGVYRAAAGWTYTGTFKNGKRDGAGEIVEPGGLTYDVVMAMGDEVSSTRPVVFADNRLAGILPAQSGGAAGKVDMSVLVDPRLGSAQEVGYTHIVQNGEVLIVPNSDIWRAAWNGAGKIEGSFTYAMMGDDQWRKNRAHTQFRLNTNDGSRVRLKSLDLAVEYSLPHLRPVLAVQEHLGCVGFRPSFNFLNYGWGEVQNATARVGFRNPDNVPWDQRHTMPPNTEWFEVPIGSFDDGIDVYVRNALIEAGVDVTALETRRFTCPGADMLEGCRRRIIAELQMGQLNGLLSGWASIQTDMIGELSYDWTDAFGTTHRETQTFAGNINLAFIEVLGGLAECGAGGAFATQAPQYVDVDLPYDGQGYRINIPFRGNPNISSMISGLKFFSERSSMHLMQMEATFADGSIRKSAPVRLFFLHTRQPGFESGATPATCTLPPESEASC
ncbi:MAG: MORN repeat-containing protein [Thalassovita sp.]